MNMITPPRLKKGDTVAILSLSSGLIGEPSLHHKFDLAKDRLEDLFGLKVIAGAHALDGISSLAAHPEHRAADLMTAFKNPEIKAIICAIGGSDTIRLLPHIDFNIIHDNPKIFCGYSDSTVNHFMLHKAGLASFYGPAAMTDFAEYVQMFDYTREAVQHFFFEDTRGYEIQPSPSWSSDFIPWSEDNIDKQRSLQPDTHGYELLQGSGSLDGEILGGCIESLQMFNGTPIWPSLDDWRGKFLLLETSEEQPEPEFIVRFLRNLNAQGILSVIKGILVGKPQNEKFYEEYKSAYLDTLAEAGHTSLPLLYNLNIGHSVPIGIIPLGVPVHIDFDAKRISLLESATTA